MSLSQWELQNEWIKLLSYVGEHYDEIGIMLKENVSVLRNTCCEHGYEFTPQETIDCLTIIKIAYDELSSHME